MLADKLTADTDKTRWQETLLFWTNFSCLKFELGKIWNKLNRCAKILRNQGCLEMQGVGGGGGGGVILY